MPINITLKSKNYVVYKLATADRTMIGVVFEFNQALTVGNTYSVALVSKAENQFVSTAFKA